MKKNFPKLKFPRPDQKQVERFLEWLDKFLKLHTQVKQRSPSGEL